MKTLRHVILFLTVLTLFVPAASLAQFQYSNQIGMYTTEDGLGATGTSVMGAAVDVFLVLTKPTDVENGEAPFSACCGFELTMTFSPTPNDDLFVLRADVPPYSIDIGPNKDINLGYLDFFCGIDYTRPPLVVDEAVVLVSFTFLNANPGVTEVTLGPSYAPSIAGQMAFLGEEPEQLRAMYSKGGSHDAPVFIFNGEAVAVENESFGSVKALYR